MDMGCLHRIYVGNDQKSLNPVLCIFILFPVLIFIIVIVLFLLVKFVLFSLKDRQVLIECTGTKPFFHIVFKRDLKKTNKGRQNEIHEITLQKINAETNSSL